MKQNVWIVQSSAANGSLTLIQVATLVVAAQDGDPLLANEATRQAARQSWHLGQAGTASDWQFLILFAFQAEHEILKLGGLYLDLLRCQWLMTKGQDGFDAPWMLQNLGPAACRSVLKAHFVEEHQRHGLHRVVATIHIVAQEQVVCPERVVLAQS